MFGQQPFGTPTTQASGFGGSTFGGSTFGAPATNVFGQTQSAFGATNSFGSTGFGQPQQQQQQPNPFTTGGNSFGGTAFGQPQQQQTPIFGGGTGLFGSTQANQAQPLFGPQPQQQQTTGLFGSSATTGTLFGQPAKPSFGSTTTFGGPSQQQQTTSLFGQPQQTTGLFGSTSSNTGSSLFGQSSSGMFGMSTATAQTGTAVKFTPIVGTDTVQKNNVQSQITTKNYCICSMKEYEEKKSLEELRLEDYTANRKYGTATASTTTPLFGQSQQGATSGSGLFGSPTTGFASTFGQTPKPTGFGTGGLFGSTPTTQASAGLFGQPTPAQSTGGIFGSTGFGQQPAASIASSFSFNPASAGGNSGGFGNFSAQQQTKPLFGGTFGQQTATSTSSTGLFGQNTFGSQTQGTPGFSAFGAQTSQTAAFKPFGVPATTTAAPAFGGFGGNLFGAKPTTTSSLFGTTTSTTSAFSGFGTTSPFGQQSSQPAQTSLFGAKPTTGFGTTTTAQPSTFGFGTLGQSSGGLFGLPQTAQQPASSQSPSGNVHAQIVELMRKGSSDTDVFSNMYGQLPVKEDKKPTPLSREAINSFISNAQKTYSGPSSSRKDDRAVSYYVAQPHKETGLGLSASNGPLAWRTAAAKRDERFKLDRAYVAKLESEIAPNRQDTPRPASKVSQVRSSTYSSSKVSGGFTRPNGAKESPVEIVNFSKEINLEDESPRGRELSTRRVRSEDDLEERENIPTEKGSAVVICTRPDYFTIPDVTELELDEKGQCSVQNFFVGRYQYGGVRFLGKTNVAKLNLDLIISIGDKEVSVYPEEEHKPPVGKGLNKNAVVTFENVKPNTDGDTDLTPQEIMESGFVELLKARVEIMDGAEFLEYNPETYQLSFAVKHFSKYKLILDDQDVRNRFGKRGLRSFSSPPGKRLSPLISGKVYDFNNSYSDNSRDSLKENQIPCMDFTDESFQLRERESEVVDSIFNSDIDELYETAICDQEITEEVAFVEVEETGVMVTDANFASVGKLALGTISTGYDGSAVFVCGSGTQFLETFLADASHLSYDSKILLEEAFELYLSRCQIVKRNGETCIHPPSTNSKFLECLCQLIESLIDPTSSMVFEKILLDLFRVLYLKATSEAQCDAFTSWIKDSVAILQPDVRADEVKPENASRAIFYHILCGNVLKASEIALTNGLYTVAVVIDEMSLPKRNERNDSPEHLAVMEILEESFAQFLADELSRKDENMTYLVKSFMLLSGTLCLTNDEGKKVYSIFHGLTWLQCLAACTLHMRDNQNPPTGVWDFIRGYQDHNEWNSECVLPSPSDPVPALIFDVIAHFCRHSIPTKSRSFDHQLLTDMYFDIRVRWFISKIRSIFDDPLDSSTDLQLTSEFSKVLDASGFPHLAVVVLTHLEPNLSRRNEIRYVLHSLAKAKMSRSTLLEPVMHFLSEDLEISSPYLSEAKAVVAASQGKKLEAAGHYFHAGQRTLCLEIIAGYILPQLASCDRATYSKTLDAITFTGTSDELVEPYTSFLEMLQVVERIKLGNLEPETFTTLERLMGKLNDRKEQFSDLENRSYLILGFVNRKLREGRAFLDLQMDADR